MSLLHPHLLNPFWLLSIWFGLLFGLDLLAYMPFFGQAFGHAEAAGARPKPSLLAAVAGGWLLGVAGLCSPWQGLRLAGIAALYLIFRHYYIDQRWASIRRGFGAPGFMSHFTVLYLGLLELAALLSPDGGLVRDVFGLYCFDFAVIMTCAGSYKLLSGYANDQGMELGQVNPSWGYFWRLLQRYHLPPWLLRFHNLMAGWVEIGAGLLMLIPLQGVQIWGALAISLSFVYIGIQIRLGRLAWLMATLPLLYFPQVQAGFLQLQTGYVHLPTPAWALLGFKACLYAFALAIVAIKVQQYSNLIFKRPLPEPWQGLLAKLGNQIPIIIWRVFTADLTHFFIRIREVDDQGQTVQTLLDEHGHYAYASWRKPWLKLRFTHVTESIAITSVFTTLKYFPSQPELFNAKLLTYARSLSPWMQDARHRLCFEFVHLQRQPDHGFEFVPVREFWANPVTQQVEQIALVPEFDCHAPISGSPVHETAKPGSYMPRKPAQNPAP